MTYLCHAMLAIFVITQKCNRYGSCRCPCSSSSSSSSFAHFDIHFSKPVEEGFEPSQVDQDDTATKLFHAIDVFDMFYRTPGKSLRNWCNS